MNVRCLFVSAAVALLSSPALAATVIPFTLASDGSAFIAPSLPPGLFDLSYEFESGAGPATIDITQFSSTLFTVPGGPSAVPALDGSPIFFTGSGPGGNTFSLTSTLSAGLHAITISGSASAPGAFEIRVSAVPPAMIGVPEPATWALMILGFGAAGAMLRRKRAWA